MDEQLSASPRTEIARPQDKCRLVRPMESVTIQPRCRQIIVGRLDSDRKSDLPPLVCVVPAQIPTEGTLPTRGLTRVESRSNRSSQMMSQDSCGRVRTEYHLWGHYKLVCSGGIGIYHAQRIAHYLTRLKL